MIPEEPSVEVSQEDFIWLAQQHPAQRYFAGWLAAGAVSAPEDPPSRQRLLIRRLTEFFPNKPVTWVAVLNIHRAQMRRAGKQARENGTDLRLDPEVHRRVQEAIARGRALDPNTALWDVASMTEAVASGDDRRAAQALVAASERLYFNDYGHALWAVVAHAAEKLGLSPYRAKLTVVEEVGPVGGALGSWHAARHVIQRAAELETQGEVAEALDQYEALLRLDRLIRNNSRDRGAPWQLGTPNPASDAWTIRYTAIDPPPQRWPSDAAKQAWRSAAFDSLIALAESHGRAGFADLAREARAARAVAVSRGVARSERESRLSGSLFLASIVWWGQLLALLLIPVFGAAWAAFTWVGIRASKGPTGLCFLVGVALTVTTALILAVQCFAGVHMPAYGMMSVPPFSIKTAIGEAADLVLPWAIPIAIGVLVFAWQRDRSRTDPQLIAGCLQGAAIIGLAFAWLCAFSYALMTIGQAAFQAYVTTVLS